jgi:hypothetical protein
MDFLWELNKAVEGLEQKISFDVPSPPSIFIIGVPRSGTTLVSQILSACADVGYVNNLMARFWMAPAVGASLSLHVLNRRVFTGSSTFGQTRYAEEPHEFGQFWRTVLNYEDMVQKSSDKDISWENLATTLNRVASVYEKPVVYKVFQLYWHLAVFHKYLPSAKWIWIRRDPVENALSLLQMRKEKTGDFNTWFSARPMGAEKYDHKPAWVQVAAQVKLIEDWIEKQLAGIPAENSFQISLDDLCSNPIQTTKNLARMLDIKIFDEYLNDIADKVAPETFDEEYDDFRERIEKSFQVNFK